MPSSFSDPQESPIARLLRHLLTNIINTTVQLILRAYIHELRQVERAGRPVRKRRTAGESEIEEEEEAVQSEDD